MLDPANGRDGLLDVAIAGSRSPPSTPRSRRPRPAGPRCHGPDCHARHRRHAHPRLHLPPRRRPAMSRACTPTPTFCLRRDHHRRRRHRRLAQLPRLQAAPSTARGCASWPSSTSPATAWWTRYASRPWRTCSRRSPRPWPRPIPTLIVGIKSAHYWTRQPWDAAHPPWASVDRAVEAGELCGKPVMVDFWPRPPERPYPDLILNKLRPGDIHTHVFAQQFPVVDEDRQGQRRTCGRPASAASSSTWATAPAASGSATPSRLSSDGFPPDTISTDLHIANVNGPVFEHGDDHVQVPEHGHAARRGHRALDGGSGAAIGRPELGTLSVGAEADVAVFSSGTGELRLRRLRQGAADRPREARVRADPARRAIVYDPEG